MTLFGFAFDSWQLWLISIAGALISFLIPHYLTIARDRINARTAAAMKFNKGIIEEVVGLYPVASNWPEDIDRHLRGIFPKMQIAINEFRPYVPMGKRSLYDAAWFRYRCNGTPSNNQAYHHYMEFGGHPDPKKTFHENIEHLLSFASPYIKS